MHLFTDIIDILEIENPSQYRKLRINFTRLVENMRAFEENLNSCLDAEKELMQYDIENPKDSFLPVIQMKYVNAIRNFLNSWYTLMGAIASIYPLIIGETPDKMLAPHEVKKQLATYKKEFCNVIKEKDFDILEATRTVRSQVISHPKGIKPYSWFTTAYYGIAGICFYTEGIDGLHLRLKYIKSVKKNAEMATEFPIEIPKDKLWNLYFPVYHPILIYKITMNLLDSIFLSKV
jgi:hypothetical protein